MDNVILRRSVIELSNPSGATVSLRSWELHLVIFLRFVTIIIDSIVGGLEEVSFRHEILERRSLK